MMSGTSVSGGEGRMITLMVGESSCLGEIIDKLKSRPETTPLQHKLEQIATDIGKMGTYVALLVIHVLLLRFFIEGMQNRNVNLFGTGEEINEEDAHPLLAYL
jgi:magnesium-transporting ATPase (P-type)